MKKRLRLLDLFSGIGGFSLGLERSGVFETVAFCEVEPYCRAVLKKHWPNVPCYEDVRALTGQQLLSDGIEIDAICGGFPCQDISVAGKGAGIEGERSGLWSEYARLIGDLRPSFVIVENVSALLSRGLGRVLKDLAAVGYDAEWHCIPASYVGAPHQRDRIWIIAYPKCSESGKRYNANGKRGWTHQAEQARVVGREESLANANDARLAKRQGITGYLRAQFTSLERGSDGASDVADANSDNEYRRRGIMQMGREWRAGEASENGFAVGTQWLVEPDVGRVANGVPARVDRLKALGNSLVPQIPEIIGRAIGEYIDAQAA